MIDSIKFIITKVFSAIANFFGTSIKEKNEIFYQEKLDKVSKENYKKVDISKEEEKSTDQTQKINSLIKETASKIKDSNKKINIKETQSQIDSDWARL